MIIYTAIDTEKETATVWADEHSNYYYEWGQVDFDSMDLNCIIENVKENLKGELV